jgi:hypothetical protein
LDPAANCHCIEYTNIAANRELSVEIRRKGDPFTSFTDPVDLPPCADESGGFLSTKKWRISHEHPYRNWSALASTHGHLQRTAWTVEPHTAHAVPFRWMSRRELEDFVQPRLLQPLPSDDAPAAYTSDWVFQPGVQEQILDGFFGPIQRHQSLVFFYTKTRQPIFDDVTRLIVGIGLVNHVGSTRYYESSDPGKRQHPIWQREVSHTLRPHGVGGLLIPYQEYLQPTGDPAEDGRRLDLARELRLVPEPSHVPQFSYRSEHVTDDAAISVLTQALRVVARIRAHNIVPGDWAATELWINEQLARAWRMRGEYPGIGAVLEAAGLPMGTSLCRYLDATDPAFTEDPWRVVRRILDGSAAASPAPQFDGPIQSYAKEWLVISNNPARLNFAKALSRIDLTGKQAERWYEPTRRHQTTGRLIENRHIIENPYLLSESDQGTVADGPIGFSTIDRGVIGDGTRTTQIPVNDARRHRAALTAVLRTVEADGDTLFGSDAARESAAALPVAVPVAIGPTWIEAHVDDLNGLINVAPDHTWLQLTRRASVAERLHKTLAARANRTLPAITENWRPLLEESVRAKDLGFGPTDPRSAAVLTEQAAALDVILGRKLTVLVGSAGTGKTTVLGALSRSNATGGPVLFLAPTGKARVRLQKGIVAPSTVQTVAQFLWSQGCFDGNRMEPRILDRNQGRYDGHRTVVIDEASMLTEETLLAVLAVLSTSVDRVILVGDPHQLPPIGPGRPFADLVAHLAGDITFADDEDEPSNVAHRQGAIARLRTEVRNVSGASSDTLRFANLFTDDTRVDADAILGDIITGKALNDLEVRYWSDEEDLHAVLLHVLEQTVGVPDGDTTAFNASLGIVEGPKWPEVSNIDKSEAWQVITPVRGNTWGVDDLNEWIQRRWRGRELRHARRRGNNWSDPFGPQEILRLDKVMLNSNQKDRHGWHLPSNSAILDFLANGEVGICANDSRTHGKIQKGDVMDIVFAGRPEHTWGFWRSEFGDPETGRGIIDLAYAITIHKSQGSDFGTVVVILPQGTRLARRELVYTALTRSKTRLVLLVQGDSLSPVVELRSPENSDTFQRNTNLFRTSVRGIPGRRWAEHLIHRHTDGQAVRSKSELLIYTRCVDRGLSPKYEERVFAKNGDGSWKEPDFTFADAAGDPIILEHLGMLDQTLYAAGWVAKKQWYEENGFVEGENLFTTKELGGGIDLAEIDRTLDEIEVLC